MLDRFFNSQTKTIGSAAGILAVSALISRILGLFRDRLLAGEFGAGQELDIYFAAFHLPDFVYTILIAGGITVVFLPLFSEYLAKNKNEAWQFVYNTFNVFLVLLILVSLAFLIFTPVLLKIVAPGFDSQQMDLTILLTRLLFLGSIFLGLSGIFSGILQYFNRFLVYSLCPILYNLGIIFGIIFLVPYFGILGAALGVILGAFLHLVIQIPSVIKCGFRYQPIFNFGNAGIKKVFRLMAPRAFGMAAYQINFIVITAIASTLMVGSIAIFNFSNNLQHFVVGIIGVPFALAVFPTLSRAWANGRKQEFLENFSSTFREILFLIIPLSFLMFLLRAQIVRIILGTGQFGWLETRLTAASLGIFCLGVAALSLVPFLLRVFFSFQDTKTPVKITLVSMSLNIILCFLFVWLLEFPNAFREFTVNFLKLRGIENISVVGLPLALSISGIFQFSLLLSFLCRKIKGIALKEIWRSFQKITLAAFLMAIFTYLTLQIVADFVNMRTFLGIFTQAVLAGLVGISVYILAALLLKSPEINSVKLSILKQFTKNSKPNQGKQD